MPFGSISGFAGLGEPQQDPQIDMQNADAMSAGAIGLANERGAAEQMPAVDGVTHYSVKTGADGRKKYTIEADEPTFEKFQQLASRGAQVEPLLGLAQLGQQVIEARNTQVAALKSRLAQVEAHPILAQLGRIASLAAAAYIAPHSRGEGLVRAAGAFAAPLLHDTPENLTAEISQVEQQKLGAQLPIAQLQEQQLEQERRLEEVRLVRERQARLDQQATENDRLQRIQAIENKYITQAGKGHQLNSESVSKELIRAGAKPEEASATVESLNSLSKESELERSRRLREEQSIRMEDQKARHADLMAQITAQQKEGNLTRATQIGLAALGAASDDYNRAALAANEGETRLNDVYQKVYPGKPIPVDPRQAKIGIDAAFADKKNTAAQEFKASLEDSDKFRLGLANDVAAVTGFSKVEPQLKSRLEAAKSVLPKEVRAALESKPPAPAAAAPPAKAKVPTETVTSMSLKDFETSLAAGENFGYSVPELQAIYATIKAKETGKKPDKSLGTTAKRFYNGLLRPLASPHSGGASGSF